MGTDFKLGFVMGTDFKLGFNYFSPLNCLHF